MLASDFDAYWRATYPEAVPLGHLLRTIYPRRWLRLYSLPEGQRFPVDAADWRELLHRHLTVFADLVGEPAELFLITGEYDFADSPQPTPWSFAADGVLQRLPFTRLSPVALSDLRVPDEYQVGDVYRPVCTQLRWTAATGEEFLRAIAEEQLRAFFVSVDYGYLLAPYAGGLDIIFPGEAARNYFRDQHRSWMSPRADGL
ncbi:hypothetical protein GKZ68_21060 (plasmid) [Hymenobacter sp. BRD128]|uniref:DUF3885 domain-containing protein n=1 Tax=Hymenobacter sp. BRD128 TaxID=2675878 RepID=UPI0015677173|nr:hypothetical protein [Hymenobacter sp. BRD128]QKG59176.1 hypothetical protein GKZ68_21060 [Hymenobacter sp. BRD128]